jgi:hypothetical protein
VQVGHAADISLRLDAAGLVARLRISNKEITETVKEDASADMA